MNAGTGRAGVIRADDDDASSMDKLVSRLLSLPLYLLSSANPLRCNVMRFSTTKPLAGAIPSYILRDDASYLRPLSRRLRIELFAYPSSTILS